jgi:hypothetical protein
MVNIAEEVCPEIKIEFEDSSLFNRTAACSAGCQT